MNERRLVLKRGLLHVETPLGIVNIRVGLSDTNGREVDSIEVIPDDGVVRDGYGNTRLINVKKWMEYFVRCPRVLKGGQCSYEKGHAERRHRV